MRMLLNVPPAMRAANRLVSWPQRVAERKEATGALVNAHRDIAHLPATGTSAGRSGSREGGKDVAGR